MSEYLHFEPDQPAGQALKAWWDELQQDRGARSALRRCATPLQVAFVPAFHALRAALAATGATVAADHLLAVAGLAAWVREPGGVHGDAPGDMHLTERLPRQMAKRDSGGTARVNELRFRRLLQCQDQDELFTALRRALALLNHRRNPGDDPADLYSLAESVYRWNERTRKAWAYAYFGYETTSSAA